MSVHSLLAAIQAWPIAAAMRGETSKTEWLFPIVETLHVMALTLVVGSIAMVDLRLLNITSRGTSIRKLGADVLPWTWTTWCVAAACGTLMFMAKAQVYAANLQFRLKFLCMAFAGLNMLVLHMGCYRQVASWDVAIPPVQAKIAGALSLSFWLGVVFFGRWVGFTT